MDVKSTRLTGHAWSQIEDPESSTPAHYTLIIGTDSTKLKMRSHSRDGGPPWHPDLNQELTGKMHGTLLLVRELEIKTGLDLTDMAFAIVDSHYEL